MLSSALSNKLSFESPLTTSGRVHNQSNSHIARQDSHRLLAHRCAGAFPVHAAGKVGLSGRLHQTWNRVAEAHQLHQKQLAALLLSATLCVGSANAADLAETGSCLLQNCKVPLVECLGDAGCAQNLLCLQRCNGRPDETECQLRCTQIHEDPAVKKFNTCAVTQHGCVKTRFSKVGEPQAYGPPPQAALDENFDLSQYTGKWYITAGLNSAFDIFPCQDHYFSTPEPGKLDLKLNWRIPLDDGSFAERSDTQNFIQAKEKAHLVNDNNEFMNYRDDWFIIASKPDKYLFVLYNGNNDAWKGYGGSTVYSRSATMPEEYEPELAEAAKRAGLDWSKFKRTDNSCKAASAIGIQ